ncbi:MAG: ABC transporter substrate-binding protein [Coxiellaceae bacterium]|jgi:putative hydroxymethylpyrimidine transport system substrate-binding protein|nr:ABC transporter substrate-binding protein [Coxiellaceae bacterium]
MNKYYKLFFLFFVLNFQICVYGGSKTLVVVLDWFINPNHAPLLVAEQEGFFAKRGLKIKFITPADASEGEKMVAANKADIAITYEPMLALYVSRNIPLKQLATLIDRPLNCLIVSKDSNINSLKDLMGKRIGFSGTDIERIILATMLRKVNLKLNDIQMINVKFNLVSAFLSNKIDGFIGGMRNFEPEIFKINGKIIRIFYPEEFGFPKYSELILVVHKDKIHDPSFIEFISALKEGIAYLKKYPIESWCKFREIHPELNNELNRRIWFLTIQYFTNHPEKIDQHKLYIQRC